MKLAGYPFTFISPLTPDPTPDNAASGESDICRLSIPDIDLSGVFVLASVRGDVKYVDRCESLSDRINNGIGRPNDPSCTDRPAEEYRRINQKIREACEHPQLLENVNLYFFRTREPEPVLEEIHASITPEWQTSRPAEQQEGRRIPEDGPG